jgi:nucleoside-diphosphate-sugar epimerase
VLVTGATGFLGRRVLNVLAGRPGVSRITAATHRNASLQSDCRADVAVLPLDLESEVTVPPGIQTVVHVAGEKRDAGRMMAVNEAGTRRLARAAVLAEVRRFVHVSSVGVYGARVNTGDIDESFPHSPADAYESSKEGGERALQECCRGSGMEFVILRPSNVVAAPEGDRFPLRGLIRSIRQGLFTWFGDPQRAWLNYVHVDDVAAAIATAAERAPSGRGYIVNCPARLADAVGWIAEEVGVPYPRRRLPLGVGRMLAETGSFASRVTGRDLPFDLARFRELTNSNRFDPSRLVRETGFVYPVGAEATFRGLARAYGGAGARS